MMLGGFQSWLTIWILILLICAAATTTTIALPRHAALPPRSQEVLSLTLLWKCYPIHDWKVSFLSPTWNPISWKMTFCPLTKRPQSYRICGVGPAYRIMPGWCDFKNLMIGEKFLFLPQITVILFCRAQDLDHEKKKKQSWTHEDKGKTIAYEPP